MISLILAAALYVCPARDVRIEQTPDGPKACCIVGPREFHCKET